MIYSDTIWYDMVPPQILVARFPELLVINLAVFTPHSPRSLNTLWSSHFSVLFSDFRLTVSEYFSVSFTMFYFPTLPFLHTQCLLYTSSPSSSFLCLDNSKLQGSFIAKHWQLFELFLCHFQIAACTRSIPFLHVSLLFHASSASAVCLLLCYNTVTHRWHNSEISFWLCIPLLLV